MNVGTPFESDTETSKVVHPGMRALHDPSNLPKPAAVWLSASSNAGGNASLVQDAPVLVVIVASIRIDAFGPAQWPTANAFDRRDRLDQGDQLRDVIAVGSGQDCRDRCAVGVGGEVVFGTGSRSIGGVRASFSPAPTARIDEESTTTREKSIWFAARSLVSSNACNASHTLASCQSRSRRQQLTPEPHPISAGRSRQRMPVFSTNRMPVSAARFGTGLRPGYLNRRGLAGGRSGSISFHNSSSMIGLPISLIRLSRRLRLTGREKS